MGYRLFLTLIGIVCTLCTSAQTLHINDLIALDRTPRAATDSFLKSKRFSVCESDETQTVEGHAYSKYSPNCKEPFQEYVTDNYHSGHHITYVFYDNNFYKTMLSELKNAGYLAQRKHDIANCKVTDYKKDDKHLFQLRMCKQDEGNKYYLSIPATTKK